MNKKIGVFIGRCQPFHNGHRAIIKQMTEECDESLVLLGSVNKCRTIKNPYTYQERRDKIVSEFPDVIIYPLNDYLYRYDLWLKEVHDILNEYPTNDIKIYGHMKPDNQYLDWFPEYNYVEVLSGSNDNGTKIRESLFSQTLMPTEVQEEWDYYQNEKKLFDSYPFKDTLQFNCADALVYNDCIDSFLLIKRKHAPGKDTWALPGGFKNNNETFYECAVRELLEETGLDVKTVIGVDYVEDKMFDAPLRNVGGILRNTTCVMFETYINFENDVKLKPADDAAELKWFTIDDIMNKIDMFHDHRDIISEMIGRHPKYAVHNPKYL
jgi:bifunctional NMN adenylyltransferase/nudix hydrolase